LDHVANYPVVRKLGEGATSEVFLCQDPFHGREVAVKRIFPESLRDPVRGRLFRKLFFTEASLAGKLDHPHIAQIFDAGIGEDSGYIVMEYVPGGTMGASAFPRCCRWTRSWKSFSVHAGARLRALAGRHARHQAPTSSTGLNRPTCALATSASRQPGRRDRKSPVGSPAHMSPQQIRGELVDTAPTFRSAW
jgi:serine/threonine protein kinase